MAGRTWMFVATAATAAALAVAGCKSNQSTGVNSAADTNATAGGGAGTGTTGGTGAGGGSSIPTLVNVNLENVLNDLSVAVSVDRANIPANAQVPIEVAANVCGVSVSALAASIASGQAGCTATTTSPALVQHVQQQVAAGGNVGGGDQTMGTQPTSNMF